MDVSDSRHFLNFPIVGFVCERAVDPLLNRGEELENLGRLEEASADYEAVLHVQP